MKRLLAILLLSIHLFNLSGYAFVFRYLMFRSDQQQASRIDRGSYDRSTLVIIKVPMQLPYGNDWADYERVDGSVEVDGVHYTYVEKKISRDTVYMACLPNEGKTRLNKAATDFAQAVNTIPENQKENELAKKGFPGPEYNEPAIPYQLAITTATLPSQTSFLVPFVTLGYLTAPFTPPDLV